MIKKIRIGTRGSKLALWQANLVKQKIENISDLTQVEIHIIQTRGDRDQASSLTQIGGQGVFTKAIEQALIENKIDIAVHSLKDLPSAMPDSLRLGAVLEREQAADVFIGLENSDFHKLPQGVTIASGSIRRRAQILSFRPDIKFTDLRGNIDTRLRKLRENRFDGLIMAEAALIRLNLKDICYKPFSFDEMLPAVGQGVIGIQVRNLQYHHLPQNAPKNTEAKNGIQVKKYYKAEETEKRGIGIYDEELQTIIEKINDQKTFSCVSAERAFLHRLDSGCQFPVAAYAEIISGKINLRGLVAKMDGSTILKDIISGAISEVEHIGVKLAERLIERGALELLKDV